MEKQRMTIEKLEKLKFTDIDESILEKLPNCEDGSELADIVVYANKIGWNDAINTIIDELRAADISEWINNASTVERSHGKWIETEFLKLRECSCCHVRWGMYDVEIFFYCPNCGADMRKEANDE